jgi:ssDNA-binding Zn-finger/Zn-ribbon topoisomerase 1
MRIIQARAAREKALEQAAMGGVVPRCDRCKHAMVRRIQKGTGQRFFGCSKFPECTFAKPINANDARANENQQAATIA